MKTIVHLVCAVVTTSALTAHAQIHYSGATYRVDIMHDNGSAAKGCMTFHESGRFTMSDDALTMRWAPQVDYPDQYMAVTAPGERTVVPYHLSVYGKVLPDRTLTGRGIDQSGSAFVFRGRAKDACDVARSERAASNPNQTVTDPTRLRKDLTPILDPCWFPDGSQVPCDPIPDPLRAPDSPIHELIRTDDPCWSPPGSHIPCDPIPDPLRVDAEIVTTSTLAGRSFRLTLGTSDQNVLEYCWTFGENYQIEAANGGLLAWSPDSNANDDARFRSVGAGANGRGMAYHGTLIGDELLQVVGIEARDGKSLVTYGYGQQIAACE